MRFARPFWRIDLGNTTATGIGGFAHRVISLPRPVKRLITVGADALMIPAMLWLATSLKAGRPVAPDDAWPAYAAALVVTLPIFVRFGLYRAVIRFLGHNAMIAVAGAVALSALLLAVVGQVFHWSTLSLSGVAIYASLALFYVAASRYIVRYYLQSRSVRATLARVAIYGAGEAGARLAAVLGTTRVLDPVAFVDDSPALQGRFVSGIQVYPPLRLAELIQSASIDRVLLAMPSLARHRRREILATLEPLGVHVQTVPEFEHLVTGRANLADIREVDVADLLGRDCVPPLENLFAACIRGRIVMVTGAGGSIGSELCRQILGLRPKCLILFEMNELALYNIERELRARNEALGAPVDVVGVIGNAHHRFRMREILQTYRVQTIYHAAAYKHVPIVEQNVIEGIHNNVIATWHTAQAAHETGVETFVLVSTDKAVNPTNVLGATKRFAEIVLQGLNLRGSRTRFCMVRFGNVLASSGSVVPLFSEQIKAGGPVTVTHPEVIRYFMTIPEAAQLVIQAGSMAEGGDVFVLDMGNPVRIFDLARRMVHLMGLNVRDEAHPDGDIEITFTGLRPAEKLFEELLIGNNVAGTEHPMIMRAMEHTLPWERVQGLLDALLVAMARFDAPRALELLREAVVEYTPAPQMHDLVWARREAAADDEGKVTSLTARRTLRNAATPTGSTDAAQP